MAVIIIHFSLFFPTDLAPSLFTSFLLYSTAPFYSQGFKNDSPVNHQAWEKTNKQAIKHKSIPFIIHPKAICAAFNIAFSSTWPTGNSLWTLIWLTVFLGKSLNVLKNLGCL